MLKAMTRAAAALALLYGARRYYRNWGTTKEECRLWLPGDELVRQPFVQSTEGVWIDAPPSAVWPWLNRIGGHRGDLTAGETVRLTPWPRRGEPSGASLSVEQVTEGRSLVLRGTPPGFPWHAVWSFDLEPRWEDRCRLLLRMRAQLKRPGDIFRTELAGPVTAFAVRQLLLDIKHQAENSVHAAELSSAM